MLNFQVDTYLELQELSTVRAKGDDVTLETLVRKFRHREATDECDKIYALLPLVADWGRSE